MTYKTILFESCRGIARLTLNRPDRLNAFTAQMHEEVADALSEVEANPETRVLLLTASGRGFCAGQDLTERAVRAGVFRYRTRTRRRRYLGVAASDRSGARAWIHADRRHAVGEHGSGVGPDLESRRR